MDRPRTCLILGDRTDPHVESVGAKLATHGVPYTVLGVGPEFPVVTARLSGSDCGLLVDDRGLDCLSVGSVWDRARSSQPIVCEEEWQYVFRERKAFLEGLPSLLSRSAWMNPIGSTATASSKITQLRVAQRVAMRVPRTCVTNSPRELARFIETESGEVILKALTWLALRDGRVLFSSALGEADIRGRETALRAAPCIFQERIPKAYEVRAYLIGDVALAARIHSREHGPAGLDWRRAQHELEYSRYPLPSHLEHQLRSIMGELGLIFGAFDLARTPDGEYVFFEVNPAGNWLWIEDRTSLPISSEVASWLSHKGPALNGKTGPLDPPADRAGFVAPAADR